MRGSNNRAIGFSGFGIRVFKAKWGDIREEDNNNNHWGITGFG